MALKPLQVSEVDQPSGVTADLPTKAEFSNIPIIPWCLAVPMLTRSRLFAGVCQRERGRGGSVTGSSHLMSPSYSPPCHLCFDSFQIPRWADSDRLILECKPRMSWPDKRTRRTSRPNMRGKKREREGIWSHICPSWADLTGCNKLNYVFALDLTKQCTCCTSTSSTRMFLHTATGNLLYIHASRWCIKYSELWMKCTWTT